MKRVYKYPLKITNDQTIKLSGKPLSVIVQYECAALYALYDETEEEKEYKIHIAGTGHPIDDEIVNKYTFLDTIYLYHGNLVFHIFYKGE